MGADFLTPAPTAELLEAKDRMTRLLRNIGEPGVCTGCSASIIWVFHRNGKKVPYTTEGLNHFIDCPNADQFRKKDKK